MGMALNMYLCNIKQFEEIKLKTLNNEIIDIGNYSINFYSCEKLYNGLEYLFNKIFPKNIVKIIFNGSDVISNVDFKSDDFKILSKEDQIKIYINTSQISYIKQKFIYEINEMFKNENGDKIFNAFNENELNKEKIYPENWEKTYTILHSSNNQEKIDFNEYFKNEYLKIKDLFNKALKNNYIMIIEVK